MGLSDMHISAILGQRVTIIPVALRDRIQTDFDNILDAITNNDNLLSDRKDTLQKLAENAERTLLQQTSKTIPLWLRRGTRKRILKQLEEAERLLDRLEMASTPHELSFAVNKLKAGFLKISKSHA